MSAVGTPRALGRSVGLSAAGRRRSGPLGTVGGLRAPGLHGVHPEEAARAAAAVLLQGEVRGAGAGRPGGRAALRRSPTGRGRLLGPGVESGPGWRGPRDSKAGPARARMGASSPRPSHTHTYTHTGPCVPQPACVGSCWRTACDRRVAVTRGPGRT